MNRFATTALALAAAGSVSYADPGDNEWLEAEVLEDLTGGFNYGSGTVTL